MDLKDIYEYSNNMNWSMIAAVDKNYALGKDGKLGWYIPGDLKWFKKKTLNKIVVMGRKTFDSIYEVLGKSLPNRYNIILSSNKEYYSDDRSCTVTSYEEVIKKCKEISYKYDDVIIIGGESVYEKFADICNTIYLTHIDTEILGDCWFPKEHLKYFYVEEEIYTYNEEYNYKFVKYGRKSQK